MNKERLLKLAEFLEGIEPHKFDFSETVSEYDTKHECGTVCCAMGWTPLVFPELVEWVTRDRGLYGNTATVQLKGVDFEHNYVDVAARIFKINRGDASILFTPHMNPSLNELYGCEDLPSLDSSATSKDLADTIRKYVNMILDLND